MSKCLTCETELPEDRGAMLAARLAAAIETDTGWGRFESDSDRYGMAEGRTFFIGDLVPDVRVVKKCVASGLGDYEPLQGSTFETYVILEWKGRFFRKEGTGDSYGEISWHGSFREVQAKIKTVTVYDFEG